MRTAGELAIGVLLGFTALTLVTIVVEALAR